ncbi:hypothetical protein TorRG33x02_204680 [Trema orientale]|uniref:Uncharacterized protein n=1 Tax=Trema orientale TaxID=63057 RepID=A0A2P5EDP7_TREOI|nr:hypothetical protein TorRG33x02_204680 [Trema orientale]
MDVIINYDDGGGGCSYSWRKCSTIGPLEGVFHPLTFWKSGELLMLEDLDDLHGHIVSCDLSYPKGSEALQTLQNVSGSCIVIIM